MPKDRPFVCHEMAGQPQHSHMQGAVQEGALAIRTEGLLLASPRCMAVLQEQHQLVHQLVKQLTSSCLSSTAVRSATAARTETLWACCLAATGAADPCSSAGCCWLVARLTGADTAGSLAVPLPPIETLWRTRLCWAL